MPAPPRRPSLAVRVGAALIGGGHPIVVQSMTNTDTADAEATAELLKQYLGHFGSDEVMASVVPITRAMRA